MVDTDSQLIVWKTCKWSDMVGIHTVVGPSDCVGQAVNPKSDLPPSASSSTWRSLGRANQRFHWLQLPQSWAVRGR